MAKVKCVDGIWFGQWGREDKWYELNKWNIGGLASLYKSGVLGDDYDEMREMITDKVLCEYVIYKLKYGKDCSIFHMSGIVYDAIHGYYGDTEEEQRQNVGDVYDIVKAFIERGSKGQRRFSKLKEVGVTC